MIQRDERKIRWQLLHHAEKVQTEFALLFALSSLVFQSQSDLLGMDIAVVDRHAVLLHVRVFHVRDPTLRSTAEVLPQVEFDWSQAMFVHVSGALPFGQVGQIAARLIDARHRNVSVSSSVLLNGVREITDDLQILQIFVVCTHGR